MIADILDSVDSFAVCCGKKWIRVSSNQFRHVLNLDCNEYICYYLTYSQTGFITLSCNVVMFEKMGTSLVPGSYEVIYKILEKEIRELPICHDPAYDELTEKAERSFKAAMELVEAQNKLFTQYFTKTKVAV